MTTQIRWAMGHVLYQLEVRSLQRCWASLMYFALQKYSALHWIRPHSQLRISDHRKMVWNTTTASTCRTIPPFLHSAFYHFQSHLSGSAASSVHCTTGALSICENFTYFVMMSRNRKRMTMFLVPLASFQKGDRNCVRFYPVQIQWGPTLPQLVESHPMTSQRDVKGDNSTDPTATFHLWKIYGGHDWDQATILPRKVVQLLGFLPLTPGLLGTKSWLQVK